MIKIPSNVTDLFQVFAAYGLASLLEEAAGEPASLFWTKDGEVSIDCAELNLDNAAEIVKTSAESALRSKWLLSRTQIEGKNRGTLSPRLGKPDLASHARLQSDRWEAIDSIDLDNQTVWRLIGSLGEPAYWRGRRTDSRPDYGASPWEMKTRNRGEEFIQNRMHILATKVAARDNEVIKRGLTGERLEDEAGKNQLDSRTPTGLRKPGPADNAQAWCALLGIGLMPLRHVAPSASRPNPRSVAAGTTRVVANKEGKWFLYAPIPTRSVTLASLRGVCRSAALARFVSETIAPDQEPAEPSLLQGMPQTPDNEWLAERGIGGVTIAQKHFTDNPNAPEPWAVVVEFAGTAPAAESGEG